MKNHEIQMKANHWSKLIALILVFTVALGGSSCKSKKRIAADKAAIELANQIALAKASLIDLLSDNNPKSYDEKLAELNRLKGIQLRDPQVEQLIAQVDTKLAVEYEQLLREQEERKRQAEIDARKEEKQAEIDNINAHFVGVATSNNTAEANLRIQQALTYYASPDVPVLLIINIYGDNQKDYDKPTTIGHYLNYLKDIKSYDRTIESIKFDVNRKVIEIELIKK